MKQLYELLNCTTAIDQINIAIKPKDELKLQKKVGPLQIALSNAFGSVPVLHSDAIFPTGEDPLSEKRKAVAAMHRNKLRRWIGTNYIVIVQRFPLVNVERKGCGYSRNLPSHWVYLRRRQTQMVLNVCTKQFSKLEYDQFPMGTALVAHRCTAMAAAYRDNWKYDLATFKTHPMKRTKVVL
jgi:hypothetical protein